MTLHTVARYNGGHMWCHDVIIYDVCDALTGGKRHDFFVTLEDPLIQKPLDILEGGSQDENTLHPTSYTLLIFD